MKAVVADTHAALWYLRGSSRFSKAAHQAMREVEEAKGYIYVPSICLVELAYLVEKGRLTAEDWASIEAALRQTAYRLAPLDERVVMTLPRIPRDQVPDLPDRVIAATALHLGLPLVTRDGKISASGIETIW